MPLVFHSSNPFKIVCVVICFIAVFVINFWFVFWIWDKSNCNEPMD